MTDNHPRQTVAARVAPPFVAAMAGLAAVLAGWQYLDHEGGRAGSPRSVAGSPSAEALTALERQAFAAAQVRPGLSAPISMLIKVAPGETFEAAVRRTGVGKEQARQAVNMLGTAFNTANIRAGLAFQANIAKPIGEAGSAQLVGLSLRVGPATAVTLSRAFDGALQLHKLEEKVLDQTSVASGKLTGSLFVAAERAGATPELTAQVVKLLSHKLDFSRDIQPGDRFSLVFDRKVTESGRPVSSGDLLYAEIQAKGGVTKLYRFKGAGMTEAQYFDELGKSIRSALLRTPLDSVRITSSFGMREHPILGFTRMHAGIDFGAPTGTPVFAAGDGVVERAAWAGGYGRWLQIKHANGLETGYGHLSRWAVRQGEHVRQGQVVAYVGSTGLSTGSHLHYEIIKDGKKVNPSAFKAPASAPLTGAQMAAFKVEQARIDGLLARQAQAHG